MAGAGTALSPHLSCMYCRKTAIALLLAVLASGCGEGTAGSRIQPPDQSEVGAHLIKRTFALMRGPTESLPPPLHSHLEQLFHRGTRFQFEPSLVQRARTPDGVAWAFLGDDAVCLAQSGYGSVACTRVAQASIEGVSLGVFTPPSKHVPRPQDFLMLGLVPDQIQQAVVTIGKRRRTIPVRNNLFSASGESPILIKRVIRDTH
jgi:hypothetical protein